MKQVVSTSADETAELGRSYAAGLHPGDVVALIGELGSGKTRFVAGICRGLDVPGQIASPTFTLINEYPAPFGAVAHIDLYRIDSRSELVELGLEEYFSARYICLIEWAEKVEEILPPGFRVVRIEHGKHE
ncbi:MAG: tRNA (adenosine(37)-N6)-threonylcarbamoyltransferase complex ATPase subunit type 1 TsaE, partial [Bacteroidota bacterium]